MPHPPGWTRTEVIVLLVLVVLVVGLFLAASARLRSEAASQNCKNNLRQMGLAAMNYQVANNALPPLTDQTDKAPTGKGLSSVFATLIPYLEAGPCYFSPGQSPPAAYHAHSSAVFTYWGKFGEEWTESGGLGNRTWRAFTDPADATADKLRDVPMTLPDGSTGYYATGSYAANGLAPWGKALPPPASQSTLILFGERPQVCRTDGGEAVYNLWGLGFYSPHMPAFATLTPTDPTGLASTGQVAPVLPLPDEAAADQVRVRIGRADAETTAPEFPSPIQFVRPGRPCDPRLPGTPHSAGPHAVMADGSVRVFGRDTSPWVFWRACVPAVVVDSP